MERAKSSVLDELTVMCCFWTARWRPAPSGHSIHKSKAWWGTWGQRIDSEACQSFLALLHPSIT